MSNALSLTPDRAELEDIAGRLRAWATSIAASLDALQADESTWRGPAAERYRSDLQLRRRRLLEAAEAITRQAASIELGASLLPPATPARWF